MKPTHVLLLAGAVSLVAGCVRGSELGGGLVVFAGLCIVAAAITDLAEKMRGEK